jgi:hypothetical protein
MLPWAPEDGNLALMPDKRRLELEERVDCKFVGRDEFISLLTSSRNLVRADEGPSGLRGLLDIDTNDLFLIEEAELNGGESVSPWF